MALVCVRLFRVPLGFVATVKHRNGAAADFCASATAPLAWAPPLGDTTSSAPSGHLLLKEKAFGYFNTPLPSPLGEGGAAAPDEVVPGGAAAPDEVIPGGAAATDEVVLGDAAAADEVIPSVAAAAEGGFPAGLAQSAAKKRDAAKNGVQKNERSKKGGAQKTGRSKRRPYREQSKTMGAGEIKPDSEM